MELTAPDYSNLINATSNRNTVKAAIADRKAREKQLVAETAMSFIKTFTGAMSSAIETQHQAQQAALQPELDAKKKEYDQLLETSIRNGTTKFGDDGSVEFAPEVLEYRNAWLDDIAGREGMLDSTVEWAGKQLDAYHNMSDERARYVIHAQNANLVAKQMDTDVKQATIRAAQAGDFSVAEDFIKGLPISDPYKEAYLQSSKQMFDSEYNTLQANSIAATEGIDAAYKYINSLEVDSATKDTLKNGAYNEWQRSNQALTQSVSQDMEAMLEAGKSWTEIRDTLKGREGYAAYQRSLVDDLVTQRQTKVVQGICSPYLAQVQSGTLTVDELEETKKTLELNRNMFTGIESTYETYKGIIDNAIEVRKQKDLESGLNADKDVLAQYKNMAQNYYNQWSQNQISLNDALTQIRSISEANSDNLDVVNAMDSFVNMMIQQKVPPSLQGYVNMKLGNFSHVYDNKAVELGSDAMEADYYGNYETMYKNVCNFIAGEPDLTVDKIDAFMAKEMDGFFARYADAMAVVEPTGVQTTPAPVVYDTKDIKKSAESIYNNFDAGYVPASKARKMLEDMANATTGDTEAYAEITKYIADINKQKMSGVSKVGYDKAVSSFDQRYMKQFDIDKIADLDNDDYVTYLNNKEYFSDALADYLAENPGAPQRDINTEIQSIMDTFNQPYATKERVIVEGVDSIGTTTQSFITTLQSFKDTVPFKYGYNPVKGEKQYEWVNDTAKENWDMAGNHGVRSLRELGYDVNSYEALEIGDKAAPVMVFRSADGKAMYTINLDPPTDDDDPKVGDVAKVVIKNTPYGPILSETAYKSVSANQSQVAMLIREANRNSGEPRNASFDTAGLEAEVEGKATNANYEKQQRDKAQKEREAQSEPMTRQMKEKYTTPTLTAEQSRFAQAIRAMGYEDRQARELALKVQNEMERLRETVPNEELWDTALRNLGISRR